MKRATKEEWIDITMEFGAPAGTWPGDTPFTSEWTGRIGDGRWAVNLSKMCSSPHNGTHSDAPIHVLGGGAASETLDPSAYLGPCVVLDATRGKDAALPAGLADAARGSERVLFKTRRAPHGAKFPDRFKGLSEDLSRRLAKEKVRLVGTDAPSVDAQDSRGLVAHKALFGSGCTLIENLDLSRVAAGGYELVALPLKVRGLCAAPVRALLRRIP